MKICFFFLFAMLFASCLKAEAEEVYTKSCIPENSTSFSPLVEIAKAKLRSEEPFAEQFCLSVFRMTSAETVLTFARDVEFDPGTGAEDIQHGIVVFHVFFDTSTGKLIRTKKSLRP